ncbi:MULTISPECIES: dihydrolipoamide acetyltransferase family protein [Paenibacillus]|uniref:Dihydrolipoamide acetyltransferase component of pyruvate dehydrogenase complex n=1 Tax=Paenibacillus campinasensis TaxID=66347 RepID=A0A268F2N5_9BACL|nr:MULTISPECIES: dihydrolipoamide acetyltransferase family protein [Paenibacillus]MUG64928.1 2-oxo acid dehydrogenase subunit E2 [Paenibacillus campinasensis]PAD79647.1 branched-chain alpha-keto acid dehydrogenase subunit E2 [Paenibacillus campinasensis]PAK53510.1 branched-chain alpha-keto acid dehydrogenase subunit E2 [Paenibacillus sp. 7541]
MTDKYTMTDVAMPQLAESLVSATIAKWLKKPGDPIEQYEPICEVITDKVNAEIPSTLDGVMGDILAEEGQVVSVGEVICRIQTAGASDGTVASAGGASEPAHSPGAAISGDTSMRSRYSPAVQTLAAQHGIDLNRVQGTGLGGRITRKDVLKYIEQGGSQGAAAQPAVTEPARAERREQSGSAASPFSGLKQQPATPLSKEDLFTPIPDVRHSGLHLTETPKIPTIEVEGGGRSDYFIDVTPIRNTIARNMRQSVTEIPHAWTMIEVDVTNLVLLRNKLKDEFKRNEGVNLTYLAFLLKAVVNAIKDYPIMNSFWAVDKIVVKRDINLSLAVGTEDSVMTPVIHRADQKNIAGLAREIDELARKTREGKLTLDDMQGGTFTVNNTGSFGSILSYPIINYPQAAILTFESIVKKPVVINDMIAVRSMANLCLSLDHRILDGVICGRFLQRVKDNLEGYTLDTKLY